MIIDHSTFLSPVLSPPLLSPVLSPSLLSPHVLSLPVLYLRELGQNSSDQLTDISGSGATADEGGVRGEDEEGRLPMKVNRILFMLWWEKENEKKEAKEERVVEMRER